MVAPLPDSVIAARLAEKSPRPCKNCGGEMPAWGWTNRGSRTVFHPRRNDFCSTICSSLYKWNGPGAQDYRLNVVPKLTTVLRSVAQEKAAEWHRSETGRAQKSTVRIGRKLRRAMRPDEQIAAASLASQMIGAIASSVTGGPIDPPEISIKVDGRILNSGTRNHNTQKTVRLTDGKIFDTASEAAANSSGSPTGVSVAVNTGSVHKGHQFMRYEEWITAGKPNAHPLGHERKPVSVAETARRAAHLTAWHKSEEGRAFHRAQMTGPKNPACRRVVRLSDGKVFESMRQAVIEIDGHGRGLWSAIRKGWLHRDEQWMAEDEWIAVGRPDSHPRSKPRKVEINK
jgi:hypothetical protein